MDLQTDSSSISLDVAFKELVDLFEVKLQGAPMLEVDTAISSKWRFIRTEAEHGPLTQDQDMMVDYLRYIMGGWSKMNKSERRKWHKLALHRRIA